MEISPSQDPIELFCEWLESASTTEPNDPDAAALATVGENGQPSVRMVLLKKVDQKGFYFYSNMESKKGCELLSNPRAALCIHWKSQLRQVRVEGGVATLPAPVVDAYFKTRHYLSRLGAWASRQSQPLKSRQELEARVAEYEKKFAGQEIPRPPQWAGYCLVPEKIEFWQQGEGRLHDRFLFTREGTGWTLCRLNP
ncbi:MAG: pyridoxamine 5'-phosphate oxidase [Proteobacteria bacterium]|nr:pyridoxamine 5'-phosphate oxidase [Pseudomonadota bacterium]